MIRNLVVGLLLAGLAACASNTTLDGRSNAVTVVDSLPEPDESRTTEGLSEYRIGPTDVISVEVFNAEQVSTEGMVDAGGNIIVPLIGSVVAAGKTPSELSAAVADKLRGRFIKEPQVVVNVKEARARVVTIDGAVTQPGIYPVVGRMTLQKAIATARGLNDLADADKVVVFRSIDGTRMGALFDLDDIRSGRIEDPEVFGNDVVVVGESGFRRFMKDTQMTVPLLARFVPVY